MILKDRTDKWESLEKATEHLHLLVELAEDDPAIAYAGLVALAEQYGNLVKLAADTLELGARPTEGLLLARLDVDLGIDTDLAKTQQDTEHRQIICLSLESLGLPPLGLEILVDARVDLLLVIVSKVKVHDFLDGLRRHRETGGCLAHSKCPRKIRVTNPGFIVVAPLAGAACRKPDELQIRDGVVHLVDNRRGGKNPAIHRGDIQDRLRLLCLGVADRLCLVDHDAIVALACTQIGLVCHLVVMGDVDYRKTITACSASRDPLRPEGGGCEEIHVAAHRSVLPLLLDGEGGDDQRFLGPAIHNKSKSLYSLTETHLVTEDPPAHSVRLPIKYDSVANSLLLEHP